MFYAALRRQLTVPASVLIPQVTRQMIVSEIERKRERGSKGDRKRGEDTVTHKTQLYFFILLDILRKIRS